MRDRRVEQGRGRAQKGAYYLEVERVAQVACDRAVSEPLIETLLELNVGAQKVVRVFLQVQLAQVDLWMDGGAM